MKNIRNPNWFQRLYLRFVSRVFTWAWKRVLEQDFLMMGEGIYDRRLSIDHLIITPESKGQLVYIKKIYGDCQQPIPEHELNAIKGIYEMLNEITSKYKR